MSSLKVADDLKAFVKKFQVLSDLADVLEKVGSLEQAERDASIRKDKAYADAANAQAVLEAKGLEVSKADTLISMKEEEAGKVYKAGQAKAAEVVEAAKVQASQIVQAGLAQKKVLEEQVSNEKMRLSDVRSQVAEAGVELQNYQAQLEDIKAKLSSFMKV